jgi:hypothetical protein
MWRRGDNERGVAGMTRVAFRDDAPNTVIPAKAGIHFATVKNQWIPAFAGMTNVASRE